MSFFQSYYREIISLFVPFIAWVLAAVSRPKTRLIQSVRQSTVIVIHDDDTDANGNPIKRQKLVRHQQLFLINTGRQAATDVQVTFNWKPQHVSLGPPRHYTEATAPDGRYTLSVSSLPPRDVLFIDMLAVDNQLPEVTSAKCDECAAKTIRMEPQEVHPKWKLYIFAGLMLLGVAATAYLVIAAIQWVARHS